jgi:hypothetical protein
VRIKEKVVISPTDPRQLRSNNTFQVVVDAPGVYTHDPNNPNNALNSAVRVTRVAACWLCQEASLAGGGGTITIDDPQAGYYYVFTAFQSPTMLSTIDIYFNGINIFHEDNKPPGDVCTIPLASDYNIAACPDTINPCGEALMRAAPIISICETGGFSPRSDSLTLTIITGSSYVHFAETNSSLMKIPLPDDNTSGVPYNLVGTGVRPSQIEQVIIEASGFGRSKFETIYVEPGTEPFSLSVSMDDWLGNTLSSNGSRQLEIKVNDESGNQIWCDPYRLITLTADPPNYGSFRDKSDNRIVNNLTAYYKDIWSKQVQYVADGEKACEAQTVTIAASSQSVIPGSIDLQMIPGDDCMIVNLSPSTISPGDTIDFTFMRNPYCGGDPMPYASDQCFYVWQDMGTGFGKWLASNGTLLVGEGSDEIYDIQGFKFIISDTISSPSVNVTFYFDLVDECGNGISSITTAKTAGGQSKVMPIVSAIKENIKNRATKVDREFMYDTV